MTEKLKKLRALLTQNGVIAYLQPVHDEWFGEYPPAYNRRVEWLTGFSGSAGLAVVTLEKSALITDGRYTLQAKAQVSGDYEVHNSVGVTAQKWLADNLPKGAKIGYDPKLYTKPMLKKFVETNLQLVAIANPIDELWENRPKKPESKIFEHDEKYSGESAESKKKRIAEIIKKSGADAAFIAAPESVCWLLNIRARDTENTPLYLANAIIDAEGEAVLAPTTSDYQKYNGKKMLFDSQNTSVFTIELLEKSGVVLQQGKDPCELPKAIKNSVELNGIRKAHIRDGVAVTKLLYWLSQQKDVSELEVVDKILEFRKQQDLFVEPSFDTIAGSGANGAIVHYRATKESNRTLKEGELFLLDSGGQYFDGTTDITRTVAIGKPSPEQKKRFTQVLKGHIALATAVFPEGVSGSQLDALARQYLWQDKVDYDHGTGHGVGCFLSVHEGPQRISKRGGDASLAVGMVVSNEPGYYKAGEYGIRIENLVTVLEKSVGEGGKKYFGFETLTCAPLDINLIDFSMIFGFEKFWLKEYHAWVLANLKPNLSDAEQAWVENFIKEIDNH